MSVSVRVLDVKAGLLDIRTRLPFRFGAVTVTGFPLLHVAVTIETDGGRATGYAADNLVPKWFDKDPAKSAESNIDDLKTSARIAVRRYRELGRRGSLFALWQEAYPVCQANARAAGLNALTGAFGSALIERAIIDALARLTGQTPRALLQGDALGLRPKAAGIAAGPEHLAAWIGAPAPERINSRHTVGMLDPLTAADVAPDQPDDGLPRTLEAYVAAQGLRYFKLKLGGDVARDLARLEAIAAVLDRCSAGPYRVTLDGNEQYKAVAPLEELLARLDERPALARLRAGLLFLEQPLDRAVALDPAAVGGLGQLGRRVPVVIDESDDDPLSFTQALALGYIGVSTKNCKGVVKSFLNRTLVEARRTQGRAAFMSAEDLTNLAVLPVQQDLLTVRLLGIDHVERNGHHYVRGLDHLPAADRDAALAAHPDLYERRAEGIFLRISDGAIATASLEGAHYGAAIVPSLAQMRPIEL